MALAFLAAICLLVAGSIVSLISARGSNDSHLAVERAFSAEVAASDSLSNIHSAEYAAQGYFGSGNRQLAFEVEISMRSALKSLATWQAIPKVEGDRARNEKLLEALVRRRFETLTKAINAYGTPSGPALIAAAESNSELALQNQIIANLDFEQTEESRLMEDRQSRALADSRVASATSTGCNIIGLVALVSLFAMTLRHLATVQSIRDADSRRREELEEHVRQRTADLVQANRDLESFAYSASHDLLAPLRRIRSFAQILQEEPEVSNNSELKMPVERIIANSTAMGELTDALLSLSKIGQGEINIERVNLSTLAEDILGDMLQASTERKVEVAIEPGMEVHADRRFLRILLTNILTNSIKFSAQRPVPKITIGRTTDGARTEYFVRDNGVGFHSEHAENLFQPFQRLHSSSEFSGSGIGLAICHRIVSRHSGTIRIEGEKDKGATVYFSLSRA